MWHLENIAKEEKAAKENRGCNRCRCCRHQDDRRFEPPMLFFAQRETTRNPQGAGHKITKS
jgi:hypothetical protein